MKNKLAVVGKSTALGFHRVMTFKLVNGVYEPSGWRDVPDRWGFAYGKIIKGQPRNFFGAAVGMMVRADDLQELKADEYRDAPTLPAQKPVK